MSRALWFGVLWLIVAGAVHAGENPRGAYLVVRAGDRDNRVPTDPPGTDVVVSKADPKQRAPLKPPRSEGSATYSFSPDDQFLFVVYTSGSGMSDGELFRHEDGVRFVPVQADAMFDARAWKFCVAQGAIDAKQVSDESRDARMIDFVAWSPDSARLLVSLRAGSRGGSGIHGWCVYWNVRDGKFELSDYLRAGNRDADKRWESDKVRGAYGPPVCAEPLPGGWPSPPDGRDGFSRAAGRLEAAFADDLLTLTPAEQPAKRKDQRDWRKGRDAGLQIYERFASNAGEKESRHWQYLAASTWERIRDLDPANAANDDLSPETPDIRAEAGLTNFEQEEIAKSPDGKCAVRTSSGWDDGTKTVWVDLVAPGSGKVLQPHIVEAGDEPGRFLVEALWSPDSQRVAFSISRSRRKQYVAVFRRAGDLFFEVPLPEIPEAYIAARYARGEELTHCVSSDYQTAKRWPSTLRLTVESDTSYDGDGSMVTALRTTILGFGPGADEARVLKSTMETSRHKE